MEVIHSLIDQFSLHAANQGLDPVNLAPLDPWFRVQYVSDAFPKVSWGTPPFGGMISEQSPAHIFLRADLDRDAQRLSYAHEVAHLALGHQGSAPLYALAPFFHDKDEREAWQGAAELLVPIEAFVSGVPISAIAASLRVPVWLVQAHSLAGLVTSFTVSEAQ